MSKPKKEKAPKKKKESATTKKKAEDGEKKKKRGSKKEEAVTEVEAEETAEPSAPERLETEKVAEEETAAPPADTEEETAEKVKEGDKVGDEEAPVEAPVEEAPAVEEAAPEEEEEEGLEIVEEKFYDLNLRRIWTAPRLKRTPRAVRYVKDFVSKRMKSDEVSMSEETNQLLWARGISKPPRHVRLRVVKDKDDRVIIFPAETTPGTVPAEQPEEEVGTEQVAVAKSKSTR